MIRIPVKPEVLRWARERSGKEIDQLVRMFPKYSQWGNGDARPTLRQLEKFANTTRTAVGYFFLPSPPDESLSIPDFRTMNNASVQSPSLNLLDTIALCRRRQNWYREYACREGLESLPFVGSAQLGDDVVETAAAIRTVIDLDLEERRTLSRWTEALRRLLERVDKLGILVMVTGTVGSNNQRRLDPAEFRGFSLTDDLAPLICINGRDTKAAQMFTLAHELVHLWLGQSALSDSRMDRSPSHEMEVWCNRVAAEILVPITAIREAYPIGGDLLETLSLSSTKLQGQYAGYSSPDL